MRHVLDRVAGVGDGETYRRHISFLSAAQLISMTGTTVSYVAIVTVVYQRSGHSGPWVAATLVVMFALGAAVAPWAGALGDRFDRRRVMIGSDLAAATAFVGIAYTHSLPLLAALAGISAVAEAPFGPAAQAFLVMLVPEDRRTWATATRSSSQSAGMLMGGVIGGLTVAAFGGTTAFLINAASFVLSATFVSRIKGTYRAVPSGDPGEHQHRASEGFRFVFARPALRLTMLTISVSLLGNGLINVAEYPLFSALGGGSEAYGAAVSGFALGGFIAGRVIRRHGNAYSERRLLLIGCALVAAMRGLYGVVPVAGVVVVLFSIGGFAAVTCGISSNLIFQRWTPDHVRARAFAALQASNYAGIGISMAASGLLLTLMTPPRVCVVAGVVGLCALLVAFRIPPRKREPVNTDPLQPAPSGNGQSELLLVAT
jgi:MFS family permease